MLKETLKVVFKGNSDGNLGRMLEIMLVAFGVYLGSLLETFCGACLKIV